MLEIKCALQCDLTVYTFKKNMKIQIVEFSDFIGFPLVCQCGFHRLLTSRLQPYYFKMKGVCYFDWQMAQPITLSHGVHQLWDFLAETYRWHMLCVFCLPQAERLRTPMTLRLIGRVKPPWTGSSGLSSLRVWGSLQSGWSEHECRYSAKNENACNSS